MMKRWPKNSITILLLTICSWSCLQEAHAGNGGAAKGSTDSQNRVGSWSCEGRIPDTSWEATECRGVSCSKNLKKQTKGESHPKLVHDSETTTECVSLEQRRRLIGSSCARYTLTPDREGEDTEEEIWSGEWREERGGEIGDKTGTRRRRYSN